MAKNRAPSDKVPESYEKLHVDAASPAPQVETPTLPGPLIPSATLISASDLQISDGANVRESLWANGRLVIGTLATIENAVTARAGADIGEGVRIDGTLAVSGRLRWGRGASAASAIIEGPLMTANDEVRAASIIAPGGIHAGPPARLAVSR